ncbi:MAG: TrgA family protein [Deltaproteobacteria bacterium]
MNYSMMPTAAKLVASVYFAALGFLTASLVIPYLPEGSDPGNLAYWAAFFGFLAGYRWSGRRAGAGLRSGLGLGWTTVFLAILWTLMAVAGKETYNRSVKMRYDGVMEALKGWMGLMLDFAQLMLHTDVILLLVIGGLFGGWLTERTARAFS